MDSSAEFMDIDEGRGGRHFVRRLGCAGMMSSVLLLTLAIIYVADAEHVDDAAMLAASEHEQLMLAEDGPVELQESWIPEVVDCQVTGKDQHSLVILLSTTLQGPLAVNTFQNMIRKLPGVSDSQLKVLLLEDAGLLKSSFWDSNDPNFGQKQGLNYEKIKSRTGMKISVEKVKEWTKGFQGLDGGWTADHAVDETLSRLFAREDFSYHSIFDSCASEAQAQALFDLQAQHVVPKVDMTVDADHPCVHEFRNILDQVSIILANGGNPDLLGFVWRSFAPEIGRMISERVRAGRLLYMGRSAGAMAASADFAYSYEPMPMLEEVLLKGDTSGLALAGSCSLRPHYGNQIWNIPARALAKARGQVGVLTPNGVGLACDQGQCFMVGPKPQQGPDIFQSPGSHLLRIYKAYEFAYKDYRPPRPNLVKSCRPQAPQCEGSGLSNTSLVMLGSGEMGRDAQEAFQTLLREVHSSQRFKARSKVLVLDDAALLTRSFWDSSDLDFSRPNVLNYIKAGLSTNVELVREATDGFAAMDEGWIPSSAALPGFDALDFSRASVFDRCATEEQKKALFKLQSQGVAPEVSMTTLADARCLESLEELLGDAAVLMMGWGNPDLLGYVFKVFAPRFTAKIIKRVREGSLLFLGLGAGAMLAGHSFALTAAPKPQLAELLLRDMRGLQLAGRCAVRPHWNNSDRLWDLTSSLYGNALDADIVGLQDGDVLTCLRGRCAVRGRTKKRGATTLDCDSASVHRGRIDNVMAASFSLVQNL